jgi:hydroxymethylbilane synthase
VVTRTRLRIASRGSQLALWQAETIKSQLIGAQPGLEVDIEVIRTTGDRILDVPLAMIGDRGLFTKEIDEALLDGRADLAVHSLKDVPTRLPEGLDLGAIGRREDPRDVLINGEADTATLASLAPGARVGTSSLRRRAQLKHLRPDVEVVDLRGNLNTRLAKLDAGEYDAIILAAAGVLRLGWSDRISHYLDADEWLPAVGQGALALVARTEDTAVAEMLKPLHDPATAACVAAERALLRALEGGCQIPIGALAALQGDRLWLDGLVADVDGREVLRERESGPVEDPQALGRSVAQTLVERGANEILRSIRSEAPAPRITGP